jgi:hypothetical protein
MRVADQEAPSHCAQQQRSQMEDRMSDFLYAGQSLKTGEYIEAYPDPSIVMRAQIDSDGCFTVRWKLDQDDPGYVIFSSNTASAGAHTLTYQNDGYLVLSGSGGEKLWQAPSPGQPGPAGKPLYARILSNGQFQLVSELPNGDKTQYWITAQNLSFSGTSVIRSWCNDRWPGKDLLVLSSTPPTQGAISAGAPEESQTNPNEAVSVQTFKDDLSQRWDIIYLHRDGNTAGILRNQATKTILWAPSRKYAKVGLSRTITADTLWYFFGQRTPYDKYLGLRTINCGDLALNIPGEGPYSGGSSVILYDWVYPEQYNSLWGNLPK